MSSRIESSVGAEVAVNAPVAFDPALTRAAMLYRQAADQRQAAVQRPRAVSVRSVSEPSSPLPSSEASSPRARADAVTSDARNMQVVHYVSPESQGLPVVVGSVKSGNQVISVPVDAQPGNLAEAAGLLAKHKSVSIWDRIEVVIKSAFLSIYFYFKGMIAARQIGKTMEADIKNAANAKIDKIVADADKILAAKEAEVQANILSGNASRDSGRSIGQKFMADCAANPTELVVMNSLGSLMKGFVQGLRNLATLGEDSTTKSRISAKELVSQLREFHDGFVQVVGQQMIGTASGNVLASNYLMNLVMNGFSIGQEKVLGLRQQLAIKASVLKAGDLTELSESLVRAGCMQESDRAGFEQDVAKIAQEHRDLLKPLNATRISAQAKKFIERRRAEVALSREALARSEAEYQAQVALSKDKTAEQVDGLLKEYNEIAGRLQAIETKEEALKKLLSLLNDDNTKEVRELLALVAAFVPALNGLTGEALLSQVQAALDEHTREADAVHDEKVAKRAEILAAYDTALPQVQEHLVEQFSEITEVLRKAREDVSSSGTSTPALSDAEETAEAIEEVVADDRARNSWTFGGVFGSAVRGVAKAAVLGLNASAIAAGAQRLYHGV